MFHATLTNRLIETRRSLRIFIPLWIWLFSFLIIFFVMLFTSWYYLVVVLALILLSIIPVFLICKKRMVKAVEECSQNVYEADLIIRDGKLCYGEIPLSIHYNKLQNTISLKHTRIFGKYMVSVPDFFSILVPEDTQRFIEFCKENHLKLTKNDNY